MPSKRLIVLCVACAWLRAGGDARAQHVETDRNGAIQAVLVDEEYLALRTDILIPLPGWQQVRSTADALDLRVRRGANERTWAARIPVAGDAACRYAQRLGGTRDALQLEIEVTAEADLDVEGVFFRLAVPVALFAGGELELTAEDGTATRAALPEEPPQEARFFTGEGNRLAFRGAAGRRSVTLSLDRPYPLTVQDDSKWGEARYTVMVRLHAGGMNKGATAALKAVLTLTGASDRSAVRLEMDAGEELCHVDGFGGNYVFGIRSPVTAYTVENLNARWTRTRMSLSQWEPQNDNADPSRTDWDALRRRDAEGSALQAEFELAARLEGRGMHHVLSVWRIPDWLCVDQTGPGTRGVRIAPDKWPEVLESIGSYLLHARERYGVEPDLFSFNEPDGGVQVRLSPEEHRDAVKLIGAHLVQSGLKTRMLLGDVMNPRDTQNYLAPAAADAEARRLAGAVAFHSWGRNSPEHYRAWARAAGGLGLPLLVTEVGVDPHAWRNGAFGGYHYALRELALYQNLLLHARPHAMMRWEFSDDYPLVRKVPGPAGGPVRLEPTRLFNFVRHFCELTPWPCAMLATRTVPAERMDVLFTAFRGRGPDGEEVYTLHIANLGAGRRATVTGLPAETGPLHPVRTGERESFIRLRDLTPAGGVLELELKPRSLLTLTTGR